MVLTAAYTDVDGCELNPTLAAAVNTLGAVNVARAAAAASAKLLFVSTDYVFDGTNATPYETSDPRNPISAYGRSKADAEEKILNILPDACIARTSWLFGPGGKCFPDTILKLAATRPEDRSRQRPARLSHLHARPLPTPSWRSADPKRAGSFTAPTAATAPGSTSPARFVRQAGSQTIVRPTTSEKFVRPAPRPKYSVLSPASLSTLRDRNAAVAGNAPRLPRRARQGHVTTQCSPADSRATARSIWDLSRPGWKTLSGADASAKPQVTAGGWAPKPLSRNGLSCCTARGLCLPLVTFVHPSRTTIYGMILPMLKRAIRRLVAPLIFVCVLAGCSHAPPERTLSVSELIKADSDAASRGKRVQVTALVTYCDSDWKVLFLEDQGASMYVKLPPGVVVQSGDRVQLSGTTANLGIGLDDVTISVLSKNHVLPPPVRLTDYSGMSDSLSSFVSLEGIVRWTGVKDGRPAIEIDSGSRSAMAYLRRALIEDLPPLGSKVSVAGVDAADVDSSGRIVGTRLFVPAPQYIRVLRPGPSDPFALPLKTLAELEASFCRDLGARLWENFGRESRGWL